MRRSRRFWAAVSVLAIGCGGRTMLDGLGVLGGDGGDGTDGPIDIGDGPISRLDGPITRGDGPVIVDDGGFGVDVVPRRHLSRGESRPGMRSSFLSTVR
jgi:hypothetical protein